MTRLYVAAGGGGDALAAAIVHRALGHTEPALIATYAWDRLWIDPRPGPRCPTDFRGLGPLGDDNYAITPQSEALPPSGSTLPRLAADLDDTLVIFDPHMGAVGMRRQLGALIGQYSASSLVVVDVGGDVLARGDERGLRSPLADSLAMAAAVGLPLSVSVIVAGPGLDGELAESEVLSATELRSIGQLTAQVVDRFRSTLEWHPTEATALLAAAARGLRGRVEIRDAGVPVTLTERSATMFRLQLADALEVNPLARALAQTSSLAEAEEIGRHVCGFTELEYERAKAGRSDAATVYANAVDLDSRVQLYMRAAAARGTHFVTSRRLAEAVGVGPGAAPVLRSLLMPSSSNEHAWPLWPVQHVQASA